MDRRGASETPFAEAAEQLQQFLTSNGWREPLAWVFHEDVAVERTRYSVRLPLPLSNLTLAEMWYEIGVERGFGITLQGICQLEHASVCCVFVPDTERHAEYALLGPNALKFSCPTPVRNGHSSKAGPIWLYRRWRGRNNPWASDIPRRATVKRILASRKTVSGR